MIDKHNHMPLYIQLKEELEGKIKNGQWEVDFQIPSENALMEEYGVGRATVREAVSKLVGGGYLIKKRGIGTFVARSQPSLGFEPLISLTYSLRALGINPVNVIEDERVMTPDAALRSELKWDSGAECFYIKRLRFADKIPLAIEESYFNESFRETSAGCDLTDSFARIMLEDLGLTIKKVEQVIVPRQATANERAELRLSEDPQVLELKRWIYVQGSDEPYYYLRFIITGNIYTLSFF
jgi:GntR family transcriptional regulator